MKRPRFALQPLLDRRVEVEREARRAVGALERERVGHESTIRACQSESARVKGEVRRSMWDGGRSGAHTVDAATIRLSAAASFHAEGRARQAAVSLAGVLKRLETARETLREATAARRSLELLKERREAAWAAGERRREAAELDEIGTQRAARLAQGQETA